MQVSAAHNYVVREKREKNSKMEKNMQLTVRTVCGSRLTLSLPRASPFLANSIKKIEQNWLVWRLTAVAPICTYLRLYAQKRSFSDLAAAASNLWMGIELHTKFRIVHATLSLLCVIILGVLGNGSLTTTTTTIYRSSSSLNRRKNYRR